MVKQFEFGEGEVNRLVADTNLTLARVYGKIFNSNVLFLGSTGFAFRGEAPT